MKVGNKVEVILSKDWVMVLDIVDKPDKSGVKYLCRTKDLREIWFHDFELKAI
jgi:hypothetical protein